MSRDTPKVCVAICNYNHERYLEDAIRSIVEQDYENLDISVVDDGSNSFDAREIVDNIGDSRVRLHRLETNRGKWYGLNYSFSTTDAEICTAHDADDISLPWRISAQLTALKATETAHNLCGFVHCWSEDDVKKGRLMRSHESLACIPREDVVKMVMQGFQSPGCNHYYTGSFETAGVSAMFLKRVWEMGFRFNPPGMGLRVLHSEDSDFNCRVTLGLQSTSILANTPYLYRRNTSTNREEV